MLPYLKALPWLIFISYTAVCSFRKRETPEPSAPHSLENMRGEYNCLGENNIIGPIYKWPSSTKSRQIDSTFKLKSIVSVNVGPNVCDVSGFGYNYEWKYVDVGGRLTLKSIDKNVAVFSKRYPVGTKMTASMVLYYYYRADSIRFAVSYGSPAGYYDIDVSGKRKK